LLPGGYRGRERSQEEKEEKMARQKVTMKETGEKLVEVLKKWQKVEVEAVVSTGEAAREVENPILKAVFQIIQRDAKNHSKVQDLIIQADEKTGFQLKVEDLELLSKLVGRHVLVEKQMIESAAEALRLIKGKKMILHEYFLNYLQEDERKHMDLMKGLQNLKRNMYPYGPSA
jgi:hypothetical protein